MSEELKPCPCPFCGKQKISGYLGIWEGAPIKLVYCPQCYEIVGHAIAMPEDLWNTRPIEDALRVELEAARGTIQNKDIVLDAYRMELEQDRARIAALEAERRWIPVGERLPVSSDLIKGVGRFMVVAQYGKTKPQVFSCSYWYELHEWANDGADITRHVTHWRPLPPAPGEVEE